jgi:hypothetical protein
MSTKNPHEKAGSRSDHESKNNSAPYDWWGIVKGTFHDILHLPNGIWFVIASLAAPALSLMNGPKTAVVCIAIIFLIADAAFVKIAFGQINLKKLGLPENPAPPAGKPDKSSSSIKSSTPQPPSVFFVPAGVTLKLRNLMLAGPAWNPRGTPPPSTVGLSAVNANPRSSVAMDNVRVTGFDAGLIQTETATQSPQADLSGVLIDGNAIGIQMNGPSKLKMAKGAITKNTIGLQVNAARPKVGIKRVLSSQQASLLLFMLKSFQGSRALAIGNIADDSDSTDLAKQLEDISKSAGFIPTIFSASCPSAGVFVIVNDEKSPPALAKDILEVLAQPDTNAIGIHDSNLVSAADEVCIFVGTNPKE